MPSFSPPRPRTAPPARLSPPRLPLRLVERPALLARLDAADASALTLVVAPAGYGKTTLLARWAATSERPVAWLSLVADDNDPRHFVASLCAAVAQAIPGRVPCHAASAESALAAMSCPAARLRELLAGAGQQLVLLLDDYQVIESSEVHAIVGQLIDGTQDAPRVLLASRRNPPFPLARHELHGNVARLGVTELRFTHAETADCCRSAGLRATPAEVDALHAHVDGWPAGVRMASLALGEEPGDMAERLHGLAGGHSLVARFLQEEVLDPLPEPMRHFLRVTALFDRWSADLYHAASGVPSAHALLAGVTDASLFIVALDERGEWFRSTPIVRDFLLAEAREQLPAGEREAACRRASDWFRERRLIGEAVDAAIAAREWAAAVELLLPIATEAIVTGGSDLARVRRWIDALPREAISASPILRLRMGAIYIRSGALQHARDVLEPTAFEPAASDEPAAVIDARLSLAEIARLQDEHELAQLHAAWVIEQLAQCESADPRLAATPTADAPLSACHPWHTLSLARMVQAGARWRGGRVLEADAQLRLVIDGARASDPPLWLASALGELGQLRVREGRLRDAEDCFERLLALPNASDSHRQQAQVRLATVAFERHEIERAREILAASERATSTTFPQAWHWWRLLLRARIQLATGTPNHALELADAAAAAARASGNARAVTRARAFAARVRLALGEIDAADRWARQARLDLERLPPCELDAALAVTRLLMAQGDTAAAIDLLERMLALAEADARDGDTIVILVLLAIACQDAFALDRATAQLDRALRMAAPEGILQVFVDEGPAMARLLKVAQRRGVVGGYSQRLLVALGEEAQHRERARVYHEALVEPITPREIDVLRLLAVGLTNREVADELFISLPTVKRHITNLYGKLGAATRTDALQTARRLGLLASPCHPES